MLNRNVIAELISPPALEGLQLEHFLRKLGELKGKQNFRKMFKNRESVKMGLRADAFLDHSSPPGITQGLKPIWDGFVVELGS